MIRRRAKQMEPADVVLIGDGFQLEDSASNPKRAVYSGGYDAELNKVYLASVVGHPGGMAAAGGEPSKECVSGLRALLIESGEIYWASDSMVSSAKTRGWRAVRSSTRPRKDFCRPKSRRG